MPKIRVDDCPAGPALDAAVARVLWSDFPDLAIDVDYGIVASSSSVMRRGWGGCWGCLSHNEFCVRLKKYSEDITVAWELVEEMLRNTQQQDIHIEHLEYTGWGVSTCLSKEDGSLFDDWIYAETAPLAITRAFLMANGVEEIEVPE